MQSARLSKAFDHTISLLAVISLGIFAWAVLNLLFFPYGVNYGEAPLVDQARRLQSGETVYKNDLDTPPTSSAIILLYISG